MGARRSREGAAATVEMEKAADSLSDHSAFACDYCRDPDPKALACRSQSKRSSSKYPMHSRGRFPTLAQVHADGSNDMKVRSA